MIKFVFWDSDNTLVETAEHHWRKHFEILKAQGIALGDECRERIYTNNGSQNWNWIKDELGLKLDEKTYLAKIDQWYFDHIDEIQVREGVEETIGIFHNAGIPQCVVSNGRRVSVMAALEAKNIAPKMKFILCKEDYEGRKPDPAPYLAAMAKMGALNPAVCLAIEDDPLGVQSAHRAGMQVFHRKLNEQQEKTSYANETFFNGEHLVKACLGIIG